MINNSKVKIILNDKQISEFYIKLKKIKRYSKKYDVYMGIDFEFNTKIIALMQILFEIRKPNKIIRLYYIIYPPNMSKKVIKYLKFSILSNMNIIKILHGAESLDIPYIVDVLYKNDDRLIDFFLSMVDTRYLCEYLNIVENNKNICKIYDLLVNVKVISETEKKKLDDNDELMGPIYKIIIDINNLSPELITYSIHDVVYLVKLFIILKDMVINKNNKFCKDINKTCGHNDYEFLIENIRLSTMERRYVSNIVNDVVSLINKMNNYFYYNSENKRLTFMDTFNKCLKYYINKNVLIYNILNINYIKSYLLHLLRISTYSLLLKKYKVKETSSSFINYNIDTEYNNIIDLLSYLKFNSIIKILNNYHYFINTII